MVEGHLDRVKWLYGKALIRLGHCLPLEKAAQNWQLERFQWLYERGFRFRFGSAEMDSAAAGGHLHLIQWFQVQTFAVLLRPSKSVPCGELQANATFKLISGYTRIDQTDVPIMQFVTQQRAAISLLFNGFVAINWKIVNVN